MNDRELAAEVLKLLIEFSPVVTITPGDDRHQVQVTIVMSREPIAGVDELRGFDRAANETYVALKESGANHRQARALHLVSERGEASLCGIPRANLGVDGDAGEVVCGTCVAWLPKRRDTPVRYPAAPAS